MQVLVPHSLEGSFNEGLQYVFYVEVEKFHKSSSPYPHQLFSGTL